MTFNDSLRLRNINDRGAICAPPLPAAVAGAIDSTTLTPILISAYASAVRRWSEEIWEWPARPSGMLKAESWYQVGPKVEANTGFSIAASTTLACNFALSPLLAFSLVVCSLARLPWGKTRGTWKFVTQLSFCCRAFPPCTPASGFRSSVRARDPR